MVKNIAKNKEIIRDARKFSKNPQRWVENLNIIIKTGLRPDKLEHLKKYLSYGLVLLNDDIQKGNIKEGYEIFDYLKDTLEKKVPEKEFEEYRKSLAERAWHLERKAHQQKEINPKNASLLMYYDEHCGAQSALEKTITLVSLGAIIVGVAIGYPALTGNIIAEDVKNSLTAGALLFILGLLGVFASNKK